MINNVATPHLSGGYSPNSESAKKMDKNERNFEDFLHLFTTQLKNQTPEDSMDSSQILSQLAQFTSVEEQTKTTKLLEKLVGMQSDGQLNKATTYLDQLVEIDESYATLGDAPASFSYKIPKTTPTNIPFKAKDTVIEVLNSKSQVVYRTEGNSEAKTHVFNWDGSTNDKNKKAPKGEYHIRAYTHDPLGNKIPAQTSFEGKVSKVISKNNQNYAVIDGNREILVSKIISTKSYQKSNKDDSLINYLGKVINADFSKVNLRNSNALIHYHLKDEAKQAVIEVSDVSGKNLGHIAVNTTKGLNSIKWHGKLDNGNILPDGEYKLNLIARDHFNKDIDTNVKFSAIATSLQIQDGKELFTAGGIDIPAANIVSVELPPEFPVSNDNANTNANASASYQKAASNAEESNRDANINA